MRRVVSLTCFVLFVLALASCGSDPVGPTVVVLFENIGEANSFVVTEPGIAVIRDDAAWKALWEEYWNTYDGQGAKTPPPGVDFDKEMVIAVFFGSGYSGCSSIVDVIESIVKTPRRIEVRVGALSLEDLGQCDALVYPLQMVKVKKSSLPVVFLGEVPE